MYQLHKLTSLVKKRKKVGRGGARGGTSGKGHKGQKARTGHSKMRAGFEGGQMPLVRRLPKRGFTNIFSREYAIFNLDMLEKHFDQDAIINKEVLLKKGMLKQKESLPIKILGNGTLSKKLIIYADAISKPAQKAIEAHGGKIHLVGEK